MDFDDEVSASDSDIESEEAEEEYEDMDEELVRFVVLPSACFDFRRRRSFLLRFFSFSFFFLSLFRRLLSFFFDARCCLRAGSLLETEILSETPAHSRIVCLCIWC